MKALTLCILIVAQVAHAGYHPTLMLSGVGFDGRIRRDAPRPDIAPLRAKADADGLAKCTALWGEGATTVFHQNLLGSRPKFEVFDHGDVVYGSFKVDYDCTAPTDDLKALGEHLVDVLVHEAGYKYQSGEPMRVPDYAVWAFYQIGEAGVPALMAKLHHPRNHVRKYVMNALVSTRTADKTVVDAFFAMLNDREEDIREDAAFSLRALVGNSQHDAANVIARATPLLKSRDVDTRRLGFDIVSGLGKRAKAVKPLLWDLVRQYPEEWLPPGPTDALLDIGLDATDIPTILALVREPARHAASKGDLVGVLGTLRKKAVTAVPFLLEVLETNPDTYKEIFENAPFVEALNALTKIGPTGDAAVDARVVTRLAQLASNDRYAKYASEAKVVFEEPKRRAEEEKATRARNEASRREAEAVEKGGLDLSALTEKLKSTDFSVRRAAINALAEREPGAVVTAILPLLALADVNAREGAADLIFWLGAKAKPAKPALFDVYRRFPTQSERGLDSALRSVGVTKEDLPTLLELLANQDLGPARRASVAKFLGEIGPDAKAALPRLLTIIEVDLLKIDSSKVSAHNNPVDGDVCAAVEAIGKIGASNTNLDGRLVNRLRELAETDEFNVPKWLVDYAKTALKAFPIN